jgi:hypothetical protein
MSMSFFNNIQWVYNKNMPLQRQLESRCTRFARDISDNTVLYGPFDMAEPDSRIASVAKQY